MIDSNNTATYAREILLARIYKQLRVDVETEPLQNEALQLYNQITLALIEATRAIYGEPNEENTGENREDLRESSMRLDDQSGVYPSGHPSEDG